MKKTVQLSLISVALISALHAQEAIKLQTINITSTAIATDELQSTDAVEVYTQEDIEKARVQNVYEFLNTQTSVLSMPSYGNPFSQLIDMHGYGTSNGNQNVVINLNGRKLNNIDGIPQLLSALSPASISSIEIIKSGGIVSGGDGANSGVINITTKKSNDKVISLYGGTNGVFDGSFYLGHSDDKLSVSASGETQKNDGIRTIDASGNKDVSKLSTGSLSVAYTPIQALELRVGASSARADVIYGGTMKEAEYNEDPSQQGTGAYGASSASHLLFDTDALSAGLSYFINEAFTLKVELNNEKKKSDYVPSWSGPSYYDYSSLKTSLDYLSETLAFTLGLDGFNGDRKASSNTTSKNNRAAFVMSEFYLGNSTLKAGYRFEDVSYRYKASASDLTQSNSLHGAELGYNYAFDKQNSLFINYAHSYQAPNIDNFFSTVYTPPLYTASTDFNAFIEPMQANSFTLGYNSITNTNKLKISAYYVDLKNEIYLHKAYAGDFGTNTNLDKSHKYGLDFYDKYLINDSYNLTLNYNYVQAIIDDEKRGSDDFSGNTLPGVSDHNIKAILSYLTNPHATISLTQSYRSEAYAADDFNNNFTQKQAAYMSTDLSASYVKETWEVFAKINNLFNQKNGLWIKEDAIYPVNFETTALFGFKLKY